MASQNDGIDTPTTAAIRDNRSGAFPLHRADHGHGDELDRGGRASSDVVDHGTTRSKGEPQVARRHVAEIAGDLDGHRAVEPELFSCLFDLLGPSARTGPGDRGVARHHSRDDEREDDDAHDDERGEREPPDEEPGHAAGVSSYAKTTFG